MIITKLSGGLANQMFQYAAGRSLSILHNTELMLDLEFYSHPVLQTSRPKFELGKLNIKASTVNNFNDKLLFRKSISGYSRLEYRLKKIKTPELKFYIGEKSFSFDAKIIQMPDNIYLDGYWQSEKYFLAYKEQICREFELTVVIDAKNEQMLNSIREKESVALHVRRGDYVNDPAVNDVHGLCSLDYYGNAIDYLVRRIENPQFYIFSDDIAWSERNLKLKYPVTFVSINPPEKGVDDLRLMQHCKHNIIANSSFSWWGAWLNNNPNKIVVAPKKWFNDPSMDTSDLIPDGWIRI